MNHLDDGLARRLMGGLANGEESSKALAHLMECTECRGLVQRASESVTQSAAYPEEVKNVALPPTELPTKASPASTRAERSLGDGPRRDPALPQNPESAPLALGATVGRYLILHPVGQGGMGVVYAAYDPELDRQIALKLLGVYQDQNDDGQARLLREAQAMARVSHPNVTAVYDAGTYGTQVFLAMELIEGGKTLRDWLHAKTRTWREILDVMVEAGRGLAAAHAAGLVHRDFKPDNVLVGQDGQVHVTDFGLARLVNSESSSIAELPAPRAPTPSLRKQEGPNEKDSPPRIGPFPPEPTPNGRDTPGARLGKQITQVGVVIGTPSYMAPEQHVGKPPDTRSDQFSFCTTLYYALYQQQPFDPKKLAEAVRGESKVDPASLIQPPPKTPRVPAWLKRVLMQGLAISPKARFDSMEALLARLSRPRASARWRWSAVLALALLGTGVLVQRELAQRRNLLCSGAEQHLRGVWDAEFEHRVKSAFDATGKPYAPYTFQAVKSSLDSYARDWATMHTEACLATRVRGEQTEAILTLRMTCLDRRLKELQALTELLAEADVSTLERAVGAVGELPRVSTCANVGALSASIPPPEDPLTRAEVERLTAHLDHVKALGIAGKYKTAQAEAEDVVEAARKVRYLPLLAEALSQKGLLLTRLGHGKEGEHVLAEAWGFAEAARHDEVRVQVAGDLVYNLSKFQSNLPEALHWIGLGEAVLARLGSSPGLEMRLRVKQGVGLYAAGQYQQAREQFERALSLDTQLNGGNSAERMDILGYLAQVYQGLGDPARAIHLREEANAIGERVLGPDHPSSGSGQNDLAYLYFWQGDFERAAPHARKAVTILEAALGPDHLWVGNACDTLAGILARQRHFAEAMEYSQRALAIAEKAIGPDHPSLGYALDNLGYVYLETGRAKQALPVLERALKLNNPNPGLMAGVRFNLARALSETGGDKKRAHELATLALEGYRAQGVQKEALKVEYWLQSVKR